MSLSKIKKTMSSVMGNVHADAKNPDACESQCKHFMKIDKSGKPFVPDEVCLKSNSCKEFAKLVFAAQSKKLIEQEVNREHLPWTFEKALIKPNKPEIGLFLERTYQYYLNDFELGKGLVLAGASQTGKTTAAVCLLREVILQGGCLFYYAPRLFEALYVFNERSYLLRKVSNCKFLIIDDLGVNDSKHTSLIEQIIAKRKGNDLSTLITTNIKSSEIRVNFGDRVAERLNSGWCDVFQVAILEG